MPRYRVIQEPFGKSKFSISRLDYAVKTAELAHKVDGLRIGDEVTVIQARADLKGRTGGGMRATVTGVVTAIEGEGIDREITIADESGKPRRFAIRSKGVMDILGPTRKETATVSPRKSRVTKLNKSKKPKITRDL